MPLHPVRQRHLWRRCTNRRNAGRPDVHVRPEHIACSSSTNSEVVVPVKDIKGAVVAVLDVDSDTQRPSHRKMWRSWRTSVPTSGKCSTGRALLKFLAADSKSVCNGI